MSERSQSPNEAPLDHLDAYDFELPRELIAQVPADRREGSRLLRLDRRTGRIEHGQFPDLIGELRAGDVLVFNDSRVEPWRLFGQRRQTGGKVELLLTGSDGDLWTALVRARGHLEGGERLDLEGGSLDFELLSRTEDGGWRGVLSTAGGEDVGEVLHRVGRPPLPPYIHRDPDDESLLAMDRTRYQTVYAENPGSIAAPTAGLHFSEDVLSRLERREVQMVRVTLHVGLGTFKPVTTSRLADHRMHEESYHLSASTAQQLNAARREGRRIVAVGTTSCRVLESAASDEGVFGEVSGSTRLFIRPPYRFRAIDALLTNFHLPKSTLLMLVAAFVGYGPMRRAYDEAVACGYRFFSYGDAMWIR
ncbi:MAG: tRNA preQ1(34) S-adenosylmethionine ribosyltransferase-isomerase QueA [Planctomycetota bacterium]